MRSSCSTGTLRHPPCSPHRACTICLARAARHAAATLACPGAASLAGDRVLPGALSEGRQSQPAEHSSAAGCCALKPRVRSEEVKAITDPYCLDPPGSSRGPDQGDGILSYWVPEANLYASPFVMAPVNTRVVRKSNALLGSAYGARTRACTPGARAVRRLLCGQLR